MRTGGRKECRDNHHHGDAAEEPRVENPGGETGLGEDQADFTARHHPHADDHLVPSEPERGVSGGQLAGDTGDDQGYSDEQRLPAARLERVQGVQIDGRSDRNEKSGTKKWPISVIPRSISCD